MGGRVAPFAARGLRRGDEAYRQALAAYDGALDTLAGRIAEYRP